MSESKLVAALGEIDEMWSAALRERGFRVLQAKDKSEAVQSGADFVLLAPAESHEMKELASHLKSPVISLVQDEISRDALKTLKGEGCSGVLSLKTPPEEVALRIHAMLQPKNEGRTGESRSSRRVWFQQEVEFKIFDKVHKAWSTTLSETGIFLRTSLSFPLYSVLHLKFRLYGESDVFECDGVIVRQEVDSDVRGLGIMFQNLKGENVRRLESFFEAYS